MNNTLGYSKYDYTNKNTDNSRNGHTKKTVKSQFGEIELDIPRDADREHGPIIVNFNRQIRKITKTKNSFPADDSLFKILYLTVFDASEKWTMPMREWGIVVNQLRVYFG